jgi:hypothetical protein
MLAFKPLKFWRNFLVKDYEWSNNFGYLNFPRFDFKFELEIREAKVVLDFRDLNKLLRSFRNLQNLDQNFLFTPSFI